MKKKYFFAIFIYLYNLLFLFIFISGGEKNIFLKKLYKCQLFFGWVVGVILLNGIEYEHVIEHVIDHLFDYYYYY